jgi:hypothetical protein
MLWLAVYITVNIDWKMVKSETVMSILFSMKFLNISYANIFGMSSHWNNLCVSVFCTPSDLSYGPTVKIDE